MVDPGILELELRIEVDDAVVPAECPAVHRDGHGGRQEALGGRADLEDCLGVDRLIAPLASQAEPLSIGQPVADHDADGEAGAVESFHAVADIGLEPWHQRLDVGLRVVRARRGSRSRQHQAKRHRSRQARHVGQEQEWSQRSLSSSRVYPSQPPRKPARLSPLTSGWQRRMILQMSSVR